MSDNNGDGPARPAGTGDRDPETGRWLPGNRANPHGRPPGYDFRRIVSEHAERIGKPVSEAVVDIYESMLEKAVNGDVAAAKLVLDRLCDQDALHVDFGYRAMSDVERSTRLQQILAAAEGRRLAAEGESDS